MCYFPGIILYFYCYLSIDPSVGRHLCFERDKKQYRGTKNDITGQKTISRDISFLCHRVIARIKAQVCDKYNIYTVNIHIYIYICGKCGTKISENSCECFPPHHALHKIFNKNTLKISYSSMPNVSSIITAHNKRLLRNETYSATTATCNCRKSVSCPLNGECQQEGVVYQAVIERQDNKEIQRLKDNDIKFSIKWRVIKRCKAYKSSSKRCNLCLHEKFLIICHPELGTLNSSCRHRKKHLLANF